MRCRRDELAGQLALIPNADFTADAAKMTKAIIKMLTQTDKMDGNCFEKLRHLVGVLCPRIEVDLETLEVEMEVGVPPYAMHMLRGGWGANMTTCNQIHSSTRRHVATEILPIAQYRLLPQFDHSLSPKMRRHKALTCYRFETVSTVEGDPRSKAA